MNPALVLVIGWGAFWLTLYFRARVKGSSFSSGLGALRRFWIFCLRAGFAVMALTLLRSGDWPWWGLCLLLAFPQRFLSLLLVPHLSYWCTRCLHLGGGRGQAAFNELRARLLWGVQLAPSQLEQCRYRLFAGLSDGAVRGPTLAARAMLDALEGDGQSARQLFAAGQELHRSHASRAVRSYCQGWLLTDAARRGAYHEVVRISARGPRTMRRLFLRAAAQRLLRVPGAPSPRRLRLLWLLAPGRGSGWSLLQQALAREPRTPVVARGRDLSGARAATFALVRLPAGAATRAETRQVAEVWQHVFDSGEVRALLEARAEQLQTPVSVDSWAERFESQVVQLLAGLWRDSLPEPAREGAAPESAPPLLQAAQDQLQFALLDELESLARDLPHGDDRPSDDYARHWRNWARARSLTSELLDIVPAAGEQLFDAVGLRLLNHGAWLHNRERARVLANELFRWLLPFAPEGSENQALLVRNAKISRRA